MTDHRALTPDIVRTAIAAQMCPFCKRGPFKVLAVHTNKAHGVSHRQLRELALVTLGASICSAEYSERARENALDLQTINIANAANRKRPPKRRNREWTSAGLAKVSANIAQWNTTSNATTIRAKAGQLGRRARADKCKQQRIQYTCPVCGQGFTLAPSTARKTTADPKCSKKCLALSLRTDSCINGHPRTPENTRVRPRPGGGTRRDCKVCAQRRASGLAPAGVEVSHG